MELPRYFIVGDRPVKAVATPGGGMDLLALDWASGELVRNFDYLSRIFSGQDTEGAEVSREAFDAQLKTIHQRLLGTPLRR